MQTIVHRTKHLILIVAGAAALAAGAAAPIASAATKGSGTADAQTCAQWLGWYQSDLAAANQAVTAGNAAQVTQHYADAAYDLKLASDAGCSWASAIARPHKPGPVTVVLHPGPARLAH
jgi:hypothetical protein